MTTIINDLQPPFEPKKTNRFVISFPESFEIPNWVCFDTSRPIPKLYSDTVVWEPLTVRMYDLIAPSTTRALFKLISENKISEKFEMSIQMLDPIGKAVEEWSLSDCSFTKIDFGPLSYDLDQIAECILTIELGEVVLNY